MQLDLSRNCIGAAGAESVAEVLRGNAPLVHLNLSTNVIGDIGAKSLSEALKANTTLVNLDLSENGIQTSNVQAFAEVQKSNNTSASVNFSSINIGDIRFTSTLRCWFPKCSFASNFLASQFSSTKIWIH